MSKTYPRISGIKKTPDKTKDGTANYGKPCIKCSTNTIGEKWVQYSYMRGDDETIRLCHECWKTPAHELLDNIDKMVHLIFKQ